MVMHSWGRASSEDRRLLAGAPDPAAADAGAERDRLPSCSCCLGGGACCAFCGCSCCWGVCLCCNRCRGCCWCVSFPCSCCCCCCCCNACMWFASSRPRTACHAALASRRCAEGRRSAWSQGLRHEGHTGDCPSFTLTLKEFLMHLEQTAATGPQQQQHGCIYSFIHCNDGNRGLQGWKE